MKTISSKILVVLLVLLPLLNIASAPAQKYTIRTPFTGIEADVVYVDPGKVILKDGKLILKEQIAIARDETSDPRVTGEVRVVVSCVLDAVTLAGPCGGTNHLKNSGGEWDYVWQGDLTADWSITIHAIGKGSGGYAGLTAKWTYIRLEPGNPASPMSISGEIIEMK